MDRLCDRYEIGRKTQRDMINEMIKRARICNRNDMCSAGDVKAIIDEFFDASLSAIVDTWDARIFSLTDAITFNDTTRQFEGMFLNYWKDYGTNEYCRSVKELKANAGSMYHCTVGYDLYTAITDVYDKDISFGEFIHFVMKLSESACAIHCIKEFLEDNLLHEVLKGWNSGISQLPTDGILDNYSVLVSALAGFYDEIPLGKPVISCSLITSKNHNLYNSRKLGFLYPINENTFYGADFEDNYSTYENLSYQKNIIDGCTMRGYDKLSLDSTQRIFFSTFSRAPVLDNIIANTKPNSYNEVILLAAERPIGMFITEDSWDRLYNLLEYECNRLKLPGYVIGNVIKRVI